MKEICAGKYIVRLLDKSNQEELKTLRKLRYDYLVKAFHENLPNDGYDIEEYDKYTDSILVINTENGDICGSYRVATTDTNPTGHYKIETQFDITEIKNCGKKFLELSKAVVAPAYRDGVVIQLLVIGFYQYAISHHCQYILGTCSFHGVNPNLYPHGFSYVHSFYHEDMFHVKATMNPFALQMIEKNKIDMSLVKEQIPPILRLYFLCGCRQLSDEGSIDLDFNCCDILTFIDVDKADCSMLNRLMDFVK